MHDAKIFKYILVRKKRGNTTFTKGLLIPKRFVQAMVFWNFNKFYLSKGAESCEFCTLKSLSFQFFSSVFSAKYRGATVPLVGIILQLFF